MLQVSHPRKTGEWSESTLTVLKERYLARDENGVSEAPEEMFWRVALAIARAEEKWGKSEDDILAFAETAYDLMIEGYFQPNSPTLMNAGKNNGLQYSACYVLPVGDSLEEIFEAVKRSALIHKSGGGCIAGDSRVWTTFCGIEPIEVLTNRATSDGRSGLRHGSGTAYDVQDLNIQTVSMNPVTGETGLRRVTHAWRFDVPAANQLTVAMREGTVVQTSDWHPFMVLRGAQLVETEARDLASGDVVLGLDRPDGYWPCVQERSVGALTIDPELGWLIGFTLGDGSFGYVPSLRQYRVRWFSGKEDVLERVKSVLARQGIHVSIQKDRRGLLSVATLNQRFVHDLLEACGLEKIGPKDSLIRIPEVIAKSPLPVVRAFLAGLVDSDGYVAPDGSPSYSTVSEAMAEDLAALMSLLGYQPTVCAKPPRGKGRRITYLVQLCGLPQVNELANDLASHLVSELRRKRLKSKSRKQTALRLPFREWRDRLFTLGLVKSRGDKIGGSGPCASELNRWSCNAAGRCRRDDLLTIAEHVETRDPVMARMLRRIAAHGQEIKSVEPASVSKSYYDLTVEDWNTYAAGLQGMAMVHNTGFSFSRLRSKNNVVSTTGGKASGPVSFLRVFNAATEAVKQGGTRRGANMGILRVDHPDILEFIECKLDGGINNFNISVAATDKFMEALAQDEIYDLVDPKERTPVGKLRAKDVFDKIVHAAWKTGDPGLLFIDKVNVSPANPTPEVGEIEATNPCGEQPLLPNEACNLGSLNLAQFVRPYRGIHGENGREKVDWAKLEEVVRFSVRFLDNVIDMNPYPLKDIDEMVKSNRRIGLGIMGWSDMLILLDIPYDSEEALLMAQKVMSFIKEKGHDESACLARERGYFPNWPRSIYKADRPLRNSTVTTVAPTGTISIIAGCSSGIEPLFAVAYSHIVGDRHLRFINPHFERIARERGFHTEDLMEKVARLGTVQGLPEVPLDVQRLFKTAHDIAPEWHVRTQAAFQKSTDNGVSKTINLPNSATTDDVANAYLLAHDLGCLGITVFRDGCKEGQVLYKGTEGAVKGEGKDTKVKPRPRVVQGVTYRINTPIGTAFITVNDNGSGEPFEVFANVGKAGSDIAAVAEATGRLISLCLRLPSTLSARERLREIINQLSGIGGGRQMGFGKDRIRSLPDAVATVLAEHMGLREEATEEGEEEEGGHLPLHLDLCPDCGHATLAFEEGCQKCHTCGYSMC